MRKQTKLVAVLSAAALLAIGASMTSFAATRGWAQEDGTWVYLDNEGERVTEEWKKSGANYYWLDEEGEMATDLLIEDEDDYYYVDANGVRVVNQWVSVENEDDEEINGYEVDVLWYYMGSSGKAYKGNGTTNKNTVINGKRYLFDEDGHMLSGWLWNGNDLYYLGDENEGWAYTGWHYLEIDEDKLPEPAGVDYEDEAWFSFQSSGKARKGDRKYVDGAYYTFDENGVMEDEWLIGTPATAESKVASENRTYYTADNGAQKMGWVYTFEDNDEGGDEKWFYLVNSKKGAAFNYNGLDSFGDGAEVTKYINGKEPDGTKANVAAKVIKSKTYLFDDKGRMLTGVYEVALGTAVKRDGGNGNLTPGFYYFDKSSGSGEGQMMTGKVSINYDGDTYTYYFDKSTGKAVTSNIKDGSYYDRFGVRADASDGNSYEKINVSGITVGSSSTTYSGTIIVTSSGKVKKSGTVTIDGVKYEIGGKDADGNNVADYFVSKSYDKDDKDKNDTGNYRTFSSSAASAE